MLRHRWSEFGLKGDDESEIDSWVISTTLSKWEVTRAKIILPLSDFFSATELVRAQRIT